MGWNSVECVIQQCSDKGVPRNSAVRENMEDTNADLDDVRMAQNRFDKKVTWIAKIHLLNSMM